MEFENHISEEFLLYNIERVRQRYSDSSEEIPVYTEKEIDNIFSCINRIYLGYYQTPYERICNVLFNITKGHFLRNGNKRIAVMATIMVYQQELSFCEVLNEKIPPLNYDLLHYLVLKVTEGSLNKCDLLETLKDNIKFTI